MITVEEIIKKSGLHHTRILNVYVYGSQIYGTASENSDYDVIIIAKTVSPETELVVDKLNMHILTLDRFMESLRQHHIRALECLLAPPFAKLKETVEIPLNINIKSLRHSLSHAMNMSWVKSKKKLEHGEYYVGVKSMFHSLRIMMFGIQIAIYGQINNWACANSIWAKIQSKEWTWEELDNEFRSFRNSLLSEFKQHTYK